MYLERIAKTDKHELVIPLHVEGDAERQTKADAELLTAAFKAVALRESVMAARTLESASHEVREQRLGVVGEAEWCAQQLNSFTRTKVADSRPNVDATEKDVATYRLSPSETELAIKGMQILAGGKASRRVVDEGMLWIVQSDMKPNAESMQSLAVSYAASKQLKELGRQERALRENSRR